MSNTAALTAEYSKVIVGKFVTQRNGGPMHCTTCGSILVLGSTFAATTGNGWTSYCADCAASPAAQLTGLVRKLTAMGVTISDGARDAVVAYGGSQTTPAFLAAKCALMTLRKEVGQAQREVAMATAPDLTLIPTGRYTVDGVDFKIDNVTTGKWAGWVFVKTGSGDKVGNQRPGNRYTGPCADAMAAIILQVQAAAEAAAAALQPLLTMIPEGYYATASATGNNDLDFWRVSKVDFPTTGTAVYACQVQRVIGGHPDTAVRRSTAEAALQAITDATVEVARMTYAREIGNCWHCNRHLTDEVSRARGLGSKCAENLGY